MENKIKNQKRSPNARVKRIQPGCCDMLEGCVYDAILSAENLYVEALLPDGTWTTPHWVKGFFEILEGDQLQKEEVIK